MRFSRRGFLFCILEFVLFSGAVPSFGGGPLYVTGPAAANPGQAYRWTLNPIPYKTDLGGLGNQTNPMANQFVADAFAVWQSVSTADISFLNAGQLDYDVTSGNIRTFQNAIGNCSDAGQPTNSIVYDADGSILTALGMDNNSVLGFAGLVCSDDAAGTYKRGWSVLNGRVIDGKPSTSGHLSVPLDVFKAAFIHEFGHLLGLDHSQINLNCLTDSSCSTNDLDGVPTMFPVLIDISQSTLKTDDRAMLSSLYPAPGFSLNTGRVQGQVLFSDGRTPAQGFNVIARLVGSARKTAVSCVSGFLFTAGRANTFVPDGSSTDLFFGSQDQKLIGFYDIPGLPPGDYTIEVEPINNSGELPFVGGSGVGPIGSYLDFQYKMPGSCTLQYMNYPSAPTDSCADRSVVTVGAGMTVSTKTDVILLGTQPRYDAWEDGP
jgi:hypothetical protein